MVTLEDVASRAGVSPATVSRCLNRPGSVRAEKRARVEAAIAALGYVPHGAARALASRRSGMIGAIFPALDSALFGGALEALQRVMAEAGYTVVVAASGDDPALEQRHLRHMLQSGIDAVALVGSRRPAETYELIRGRGIPYLTLWRTAAENSHPAVGFDNGLAAEKLTDYLTGLGHERFAVFSGFIDRNDRAADRLAGVERGLAKAGLGLDPALVFQRSFGLEAGREMLRLALDVPKPPTAVICGAEPFAYGALFEAAELGLQVPDDISIAGFDNLSLAAHIRPSLTTLATPQREIGEQAASYLLAKLAGEAVQPPPPLATSLVIRQSTGRPPKAAVQPKQKRTQQ